MSVIFTKYAGKCCECGVWVPSSGKDRGYAVKGLDNHWKRYCRTCSPERLSEPARKLTKEGRIYIPFEEESLNYLRSIPGSWFDRTNICWHVSLKEGDRYRLLEIAENLNLEIAPELIIENIKNEDSSLFDFQKEGVHWLSRGQLRLLADDMGLGKTVQTVMAFPKNCAAIVVCPLSVKLNWKKEIEKWRPEFNVFVSRNSRDFHLPGFGEVVICNYENLPEYLEVKKTSLKSKPWDLTVLWPNSDMANHSKNLTVVIDEAQKVKNYKTKRSKRVKGLCLNAKHVWGLTGTPLENRPEDLYGILDCLRMQQVVFGSWKRFVEYMNGYKNSWGSYEWGDPNPIVKELLRRVMLRRKREDVLKDLPDKTYSYIKVDVPSNISKDLDDLWEDNKDIINSGELPPFEKFSKIRAKLANSRVDTLIDLIEDHEEDNVPLVVFSAHVEPLDRISEREGWKKITGSVSQDDRQKIVEEFQSGKLKGIAVSIKAGGTGISLTHAWKAIFIDIDWVPGSNVQAEDRICRIGQRSNKVEISRMISNHPLDIHLFELISTKMKIIQQTIGD
jgi:SWI/SNF-related matrix-associated actin-dependent regulator of chromatin subfamily A-like protein 1